MSDRRLTRDQLAKFLPSHEAVKAFEQLFKDVNETIPADSEALALQVESNTNDISDLQGAVDDLEGDAGGAGSARGVNLDPIIKRIEALEMLIYAR